jgi:adenine-specific DNA-methyltransferase
MIQTDLEILSNHVSLNISEENISDAFRPIQYLGSKLRLVKEISEIIESNKTSNLVCDLFSGSGVVSHYLANKNDIISLDIQYYSTVISSALINGKKLSKSEIESFISEAKSNPIYLDLEFIYEPLTCLEESLLKSKLISDDDKIKFAEFVENCSVYSYLKSSIPFNITDTNYFVLNALKQFEERYNAASKIVQKTSYCSLYYGGVYFSFKQSIMIDALLLKINKLKSLDQQKYSILLASLLSTLSEIVATVGKQFAQPMKLTDRNNKPKKLLASRSVRDRNYDVEYIFTKWVNAYSSNCFVQTNNKSITSDYKYFLNNCKENIGCFYADPPYTIDHYSRFYHILESIALYDYPELALMKKSKVGNAIMKGLYRVNRHQSLFSIPSRAKGAFIELFNGASKFNCPLLLSYSPFDENTKNRPRLLTIDEIISLAKIYYESVEVYELKEHKHRKLNKGQNNNIALKNGEVMILCKKR